MDYFGEVFQFENVLAHFEVLKQSKVFLCVFPTALYSCSFLSHCKKMIKFQTGFVTHWAVRLNSAATEMLFLPTVFFGNH